MNAVQSSEKGLEAKTYESLATSDLSLQTWYATLKAAPGDLRADAFDLLPIPALIVNPIGDITACTDTMVQAAGLTKRHMLGQPWWKLLSPCHDAEQAGPTRAFTFHAVDGDKNVGVRFVPLSAAKSGVPVLLILETAASSSVGETASITVAPVDVAHELRSLLLSFSLSLSALAEYGVPIDSDSRRLFHVLQRSAVHLQTMLENLLDVASADAQRLGVSFSETDLSEVTQEAAVVVGPLLEQRGQRILFDVPPDPVYLAVDGQRIRQVIVNLLHNAVKYGPRGEPIAVQLQRDGQGARLTVHDHGPGIPPDEQSRLFDRFFRGAAASSDQRGTGLGLAIAKMIVEAHGGQIGVESAPGQGSAFWFTLPAR